MEHEVTIALISMAGGVAIALIAAFSAYMKAHHVAQAAANKREVEELARRTARKTELNALKQQLSQLEKENARLKRRITCLDKALRESTNKTINCDE